MKKTSIINRNFKIFSIVIFLCSFSTPAMAYLDPGSGSMILYFLAGIFATLIYSIKSFFFNLLITFNRFFYKDKINLNVKKNIVFYSEGGQYWHVFKPVIAYNILQSIKLLSDGSESFMKNCIAGIKPNKIKIQELLNSSLMLVTALAPVIGYDNASIIAKSAHKNGTTLKEEAIKQGFVTEDEYIKIVRPEKMISPS